jgi:hypothetical protein
MISCPHCSQPIRFRTILFAAYPVWISCPSCHAKLVGSRFVKIQGFVLIPILGVTLGLAVVLTRQPFLYQIALAVGGSFIIGLPNVAATLRWGRYLLRTPR